MNKEDPYIIEIITTEKRLYNKDYGDDRICVCGHPYYRHFDTYEDMATAGCKYCHCFEFEPVEPIIQAANRIKSKYGLVDLDIVTIVDFVFSKTKEHCHED